MSLLDHLWDETVAGPQPDSGLGKLRKLSSFSQTGSSSWTASGGSSPALTRSLTFLRTATSSNGFGDSGTGSAPASPASVPSSPSPLSREILLSVRFCFLFSCGWIWEK
jgi:Dormancy/auxin associated protein